MIRHLGSGCVANAPVTFAGFLGSLLVVSPSFNLSFSSLRALYFVTVHCPLAPLTISLKGMTKESSLGSIKSLGACLMKRSWNESNAEP